MQTLRVLARCTPGVAALSRRLTATGRLIDQSIYQLYGLTPAEIAIVEGGQE